MPTSVRSPMAKTSSSLKEKPIGGLGEKTYTSPIRQTLVGICVWGIYEDHTAWDRVGEGQGRKQRCVGGWLFGVQEKPGWRALKCSQLQLTQGDAPPGAMTKQHHLLHPVVRL